MALREYMSCGVISMFVYRVAGSRLVKDVVPVPMAGRHDINITGGIRSLESYNDNGSLIKGTEVSKLTNQFNERSLLSSKAWSSRLTA